MKEDVGDYHDEAVSGGSLEWEPGTHYIMNGEGTTSDTCVESV